MKLLINLLNRFKKSKKICHKEISNQPTIITSIDHETIPKAIEEVKTEQEIKEDELKDIYKIADVNYIPMSQEVVKPSTLNVDEIKPMKKNDYRFNHSIMYSTNDLHWENEHKKYVEEHKLWGHGECLICNKDKLHNSGNLYRKSYYGFTSFPDYKPVYDPILPDEGEISLIGATEDRNNPRGGTMKGAYAHNKNNEFNRRFNNIRFKVEVVVDKTSNEIKRELHNKMIKEHMTHEDPFIRLMNNEKAAQENVKSITN